MSYRRAGVFGGALAVLLAITSKVGLDYVWDAGPAVRALARGDLHAYLLARPQMGPLSLFLRAPLEALAGPGSVWGYRLGALACMAGLVALAAVLARRLPRDLAAGAVLLLVANPATLEALRLGHPENALLAAFAVAAVLAAPRRPLLGGLLLGGAIATKQTGLIALVPVLVAAPRGTRVRVAAVAAAATGVAYLPWFALAPHSALAALHNPAFGVSGLRTGNVWLPLATHTTIDLGGGAEVVSHAVPPLLRAIAHPLIAVLLIVPPAIAARRRALDPLALLALLGLLRCGLDPWDHGYYHATFLTAIVAWEVLVARRLPYVSLVCAACIAVVFSLHDVTTADLLYVAWAGPCCLWLGRRALAPAGAGLASRRPHFTPRSAAGA